MAKPKKRNKRKAAQTAKPDQKERRSFLTAVPYVVGGAVVIGGAGVWGVTSVRADLAEQDLSIIGSGVPTIVQVHDPTCPVCLRLQKETRAALEMMPDADIAYRVASITSDVGSAFASAHGSSHATLLLFDGSGTITRRIQGEQERNMLYAAFMAHADL